MVNLDTGAQDVFNVYDSEGNEKTELRGQLPIAQAINLLVYYYE